MSIGRLFFAWAGNEPFSAEAHAVCDERVFRIAISEAEGEHARAEVEIRNPGVGLLSPARQQRCWISAEILDADGQATAVVPLFSGRVVGVPANFTASTVTVTFVGRPSGWSEAQAAAVAELQVEPQWDPLLVPEADRDDPASVLEGYPGLLQWDRVSGEVSYSPLIADADMDVIDLEGLHLQDSLQVELGDTPINAVRISCSAQWEQAANAVLDLSNTVKGLFPGGSVSTYTGESFVDSWPKAGDSIGGDSGWTVARSSISPLSLDYSQQAQWSEPRSINVGEAPTLDPEIDASPAATVEIKFPRSWFNIELLALAEYRQRRTETAVVTVTAALQPIVEFEQPEEISVSCEDLTVPVDDDGLMPLGSSLCDSYFLTPRGQRTINAMLCRASARLAKAARCVEIEVEVPYEAALDVTCARAARIVDDRLPGGEATGKIISYELVADGDSGQLSAKVKIACAIGSGSAPATATGDQVEAGGVVVDAWGDQQPTSLVNPLLLGTRAYSVLTASLVNGPAEQQAAILNTPLSGEAVKDTDSAKAALEAALGDMPTSVEILLRNLETDTDLANNITVEQSGTLQFPRNISLV